MNKEYEVQFRKISKISSLLVKVSYAYGALVLIAALLLALKISLLPELGGNYSVYSLDISAEKITRMGNLAKSLLISDVIASSVITLMFVFLAIKLLKCFQSGAIYSVQSTKAARYLAWYAVFHLVFNYLNGFFVQLISFKSWQHIHINLGSGDLKNLLIISVLWLLVWALEIGAALKIDSEMAI